MAETSSGLADRVGGIEADLDAMRRFLSQAAGPGSATAVGDLVTAMGRAVDRRIRTGEALRAGRDRLAASGARLAAMISTEADLARLPDGRLQATRLAPLPTAELRLVLDR